MAAREDSSSGLREVWEYVDSQVAPQAYTAITDTMNEQIRTAVDAATKQAGKRGAQWTAVLTAEVTAEVASEVAAEATAEANAAPDCLVSRNMAREFAAAGQ